MKRLAWIGSVVGILLFHLPVGAQVEMPQSVVANGGGNLSGVNHAVSGTVGQAVIGFMSGPSNLHPIGFWHPAWLLTPVEERESILPVDYWFGPNQPNPFNPVTTLEFSIPARSRVVMKVYDVNGREVMTVVDEDLGPGRHTRTLDAEGLSSGIYFCRMVAGRFVETRKVVLLK